MQIVFQDPYASLDPRLTVGAAIAEPLQVHKITGDHRRAGRRAARARRPGARPRQALPARVLRRPAPAHRHRPGAGPRPEADRARRAGVGARRVASRPASINLLQDLQDELGLTYLFIAHDLSVVRHISDTVAVMYLGKLMEIGPAEDALHRRRPPVHAGAAVGGARARSRRSSATASGSCSTGDVPSPIDPPSGCRFRTRCPKAQARCADEEPELDRPRLRPPGGLPLPGAACRESVAAAVDFDATGSVG